MVRRTASLYSIGSNGGILISRFASDKVSSIYILCIDCICAGLLVDWLSSWRVVFYAQAVCLLPFVIGINCVPLEYIDNSSSPKLQKESLESKEVSKLKRQNSQAQEGTEQS